MKQKIYVMPQHIFICRRAKQTDSLQETLNTITEATAEVVSDNCPECRHSLTLHDHGGCTVGEGKRSQCHCRRQNVKMQP